MSFDIYVHVPARSWPTARQLDEALVGAGYPVRLGERSDAAWDAPLAPVEAEPIRLVVQDEAHAQLLGVPVGTAIETPDATDMPVTLDGVMLDPDFGMEMVTDPEKLNARLQDFTETVVAESGDHLIWFSHHVDQRNYNAGIYILSALILTFDGYGFELQGMSHGREAFVGELMDSLYPAPVANPFE